MTRSTNDSDDTGTMKKTFPIGDVLTVATGRMVAERGFDAVYELLEFLFGFKPFTHYIPRMVKICLPHLRAQIPQIDVVDQEVARLDRDNQEIESRQLSRSEKIVAFQELAHAWRRDIAEKIGDELTISIMPDPIAPQDPVEALTEMREDRSVIVVLRDENKKNEAP